MRSSVALLGGLSLLLACGAGTSESSDEATETTLTATTGVTPTTGGVTNSSISSSTVTGPTSADTTTSSGDTSSDDGVVFDLGAQPDAPPMDDGCAGIDFLFVIDNSGSMGAQQTQLLASFDGFILGIEESLDEVDSFHVGVVTSDDYGNNEAGCQVLGDLVTQTPAGGVCGPFAGGDRFLTDADNIATQFPCIGEVGIQGSGNERPISALMAALSEGNAAPGACNENFIRDDAILVVVVVTDDPPVVGFFDDAEPSIDTSGWAPAVLAAKGNNPEAVVVIGFIPWQDVSCVPLTTESPNLIGFVDAFGEQGIKASICEPDYGPVFQSTLQTIKTTCDNFDPPG